MQVETLLHLKLFEELSPGVKLVALNNKEAVFERDEDFISCNKF